MLKTLALYISAMSISFSLFAQFGDQTKSIIPIQEEVDEHAEYPGGFEAFYQFIQRELNYPLEARVKGIEGQLYLRFTVAATGVIDTSSVTTILGLESSCNKEAERAVKASTIKWTPAKKDGKSVAQQFVIPVKFKLTPAVPQNDRKPIKTVVIPKSVKGAPQGWDWYHDPEMNHRQGKVFPGDTVEVIGHAAWLFAIRVKQKHGYISWRALQITPDLQELANIIEKESPYIEKYKLYTDSVKHSEWLLPRKLALQPTDVERKAKSRADSIDIINNSSAFLRLSSTKQSVFSGECAVVDLALYIHEDNKLPLRFYELRNQYGQLLPKLYVNDCWVASNNISDITGQNVKMGGKWFTVYTLFSAAYCPMKNTPINFQPMQLQLAQMKLDELETMEKLATYTTKPLTIAVKPFPPGATGINFVGNFQVTDVIHTEKVVTGIPFKYSVTVLGEGLTFSYTPKRFIEQESFKAKLMIVTDADTIINNAYFSKKKFTYSITYSREGSYTLSDIINFSAYNPKTKEVTTLKSSTSILVHDALPVEVVPDPSPYANKDNFIAVDVSTSMQIEDYKPYRLKAALTGVQNFLVNRATCDIGMIAFGGNAVPYSVMLNDSCYSARLIQSINGKLVTGGTAIGDAIWLAANSVSTSGTPKKLVIIGDGDNTAGFLTPKTASEIAKKYKLKIYAIGLGTAGLVQFGKDENGEPLMVDKTFSDVDFKAIALATGGNYYWAKDAAAVTKILKLIFTQ
jgi:TonB family protein